MSPMSAAALLSTMLRFARICHLQQSCFHTIPTTEARNKDDLTPLLLTVSERKQQMVEFLVKKEANIHVFDKKKRTALMFAVSYESNAVSLLQHSVNIFSQDVFGWTAEECAVISGVIIHQLITDHKEKRYLLKIATQWMRFLRKTL
ncbi:hypothetical protein MJG53_001836 [Ovis ammon polii x Ovis aries]|uniref:Uncharacterized protein n=1 Tax=Ovis ammon polii x Ovis aries TaxID=2918886 RepID=A0ACB9VM36_9CETA|nr:hypothetical protein MJG53_001836 [Ovis ammon polii x Ovis aries]